MHIHTDNAMAEGAQCQCTFVYAISAIIGHFSPDFASINYSRRLRISNKKMFAKLAPKVGFWAGVVEVLCSFVGAP